MKRFPTLLVIALTTLLSTSAAPAQDKRAYVVGSDATTQAKVQVYDAVTGAYLSNLWQCTRPCGGGFQLADSVSGALTPDNSQLWLPDTELEESGGGVYVVDTRSGGLTHVNLGFGTFFPLGGSSVAFSPDGKTAYVAAMSKGLVVVDVASQLVTQTIAQTGSSFFVAASPDGSRLYLSNSAGYVTVFDRATLNLIATVQVEAAASVMPYLGITPDGRKLFVTWQSDVDVIDTQSLTVTGKIAISGGGAMAVTADGKRAFIANRSDVVVVDTSSLVILRDVSVGAANFPNVAISPDGSSAWVAGNSFLSSINTSTYAVTPVPCPGGVCSAYELVVFEHSAPTLTESSFTPSGVQNLTTLGSSDWAHWGLTSSTSFDHKASGLSQISNLAVVNGEAGSVGSFSGSPAGYSWTDGTPTSSTTNTTTGVYISGAGKGFRITLPADSTPRAVTLFVGLYATSGKMVAHLSDGSVADFVDTSFSAGASAAKAYTFTYQTASPGQTLTLTFTNAGTGGNVNLQAAALVSNASLPQDFGIAAQAITSTVTPGNSASYTVTVSAVNGFPGMVGLSATGLPAGAAAIFSPTTVTGGGTSTLTVTTTAMTPGGTSTLTVTGTSGLLSHSTQVSMTVLATAPDFTFTAQPASASVAAGKSTSFNVTVGALNGFSGMVALTAGGLPGGAVGTYVPAAINGAGTSMLTVTTATTTPPGTYSLTLTGTSGILAHSAQVSLVVSTTLGGTFFTPSGVQNLTSLGTTDWAHWGLIPVPSFDHKAAGGGKISDYAVVNGQAGLVTNFSGNPYGYTWTDGAPHGSITNTTSGVYISGAGRGFQISVPADTTARTVTIYLGVYATTGKLAAHLTDNSSPDFVDTSLSNAGSVAGAYTLQYQAGSAGQALTLTFTNAGSGGNVNLQAAALTSPGVATDFTISGQAVRSTVTPGASASYTITVGSANGFSGVVTLSASGLPGGTAAGFVPPTITGSGTSALTVTTESTTSTGTFTLTITGTSGMLSHSTQVTLTVNAGGAIVSGVFFVPSGGINLTAASSDDDWAHWGLIPVPSFDHSASGGGQISDYTVVNGEAGLVASFGGLPYGFSWIEGTPHASITDTTTGVYISGAGRGFQIKIPADDLRSRRVVVYLGVYATTGKLVAHLSDNSAADFADLSLTSTGSSAGGYAITYQAGSPGQTLTITFTNAGSGGNVNLQAATLQVGL